MTQKSNFHVIESKRISNLRLWIGSTFISLLFLFGIMFFLIFLGSYSNSDSYIYSLFFLSIEKIIASIILFVILMNTLICEIIKYFLKRSKKKYNKVTIDSNGIIFFNTYNQTIIAKIHWKNIQPRTNEKFDIDYSYCIGYRTFSLYFFWNLKESSDSKIPLWSSKKFAGMFAKFTNQADLIKAFLLGISTFRPDITINPEIYSFYKLDPVTFEKDNHILKKEKQLKLLVIVCSIIMILLLLFITYICM